MFEKIDRLSTFNKWALLAAYYTVCYLTGALVRVGIDSIRYKR